MRIQQFSLGDPSVARAFAASFLVGAAGVVALLLPGCGASRASTSNASRASSSNVAASPALLARAIDERGSVAGLIDPQRGLVVVRDYTDGDDGAYVHGALRMCRSELARTVHNLDAHVDGHVAALRCAGDECRDPSERVSDPNRVFVFTENARGSVVLDAVLLLGDATDSDRSLEESHRWARAQLDHARSSPCVD